MWNGTAVLVALRQSPRRRSPPCGRLGAQYAAGTSEDASQHSFNSLHHFSFLLIYHPPYTLIDFPSFPYGPMDKAFAYGAKDSGFESPFGLFARAARADHPPRRRQSAATSFCHPHTKARNHMPSTLALITWARSRYERVPTVHCMSPPISLLTTRSARSQSPAGNSVH